MSQKRFLSASSWTRVPLHPAWKNGFDSLKGFCEHLGQEGGPHSYGRVGCRG